MNAEHIQIYRQAKTNIQSLNEGLAEKRNTVIGLQRQIGETQQAIGEIRELLRKEDLALDRPSRLRQPTLTQEQYEAQRQTAAELEATLPILDGQIEPAKRQIVRLERELSEQHRLQGEAINAAAADLLEQSIDKLVDCGGELFKDVVMATIAKEDSGQGYTHEENQRFKRGIAWMVFDRLYPRVFGDEAMPDLREANQHIIAALEGAAA